MMGMATGQIVGIALALAAMLTYAGVVLLVTVASKRLDSNTGTLLATMANLATGLVLLGLQWVWKGPLAAPTLSALGGFAVAGVFATYLGRWLFFRSVELIGPSRTSGFQSASPLITAMLGWMFLGEQFGLAGTLGLLVGFAGLLAMGRGAAGAKPGRTTAATAVPGPTLWWIGVGSAAAYAVSHILRAAAVREWHEPLAGAALGAVTGLLALLLASRRELRSLVPRIQSHRHGAGLYVTVGILQLVAQAMTIAAMNHIPASFTALITMCSPLVVIPVSYYVLRIREGLTRLTLIGMLLTAIGVVALSINGAHP